MIRPCSCSRLNRFSGCGPPFRHRGPNLERPRRKKETRAKEKSEGKAEASLKPLLRHWVHSHEEDHEGVTVFRPADFPFPPSRGRRGFELRARGAAALSPVGATDRIETAPGKWNSREAS